MEKEVSTNQETKWYQRLAIVVYYFGLLLSLAFAIGAAASVWQYQDWLPYISSSRLFAFGATGLGTIVFFEFMRRIASYVSFNTNFLDKKFPKLFLVLLIIFVSVLVASALMKYIFEPSMEGRWKVEQKAVDEKILQELLVKFEEERNEAKECLQETQLTEYEKAKDSCDARYRRVKLGYDSCMKYGWREMCLQGNDHEVIDCSEEALMKPEETYYTVCALDALSTKREIDELQIKIEKY